MSLTARMRLIQLQNPLRAAAAGIWRAAIPSFQQCASRLSLDTAIPFIAGRRYASTKSQGAYKLKPKRTIPKKLGAKRTGDQYVIPGNILFKQRGTLWWPGENCIMGRDHTIHSMASGYVKYYRDPARHPDRKYIGVTFRKEDTLPYPRHAERKRKLNMSVNTIKPRAPVSEVSASGIPLQVVRPTNKFIKGVTLAPRVLKLRKDYSYREDNWQIGQLITKSKYQYRSRRSRFRQRRWSQERNLAGQRKAAERMKDQVLDEWTIAARAKKMQQQQAKQREKTAKKKLKAQKVAASQPSWKR